MNNEQSLLENMRAFDKAHTITQIIFIGKDGVCRNYEFDLLEED